MLKISRFKNAILLNYYLFGLLVSVMLDDFKIYIDRLRNGATEQISGTLSSDVIDVDEEELQFHHPVYVNCEAYLVKHELILNFEIKTIAQLPCKICNQLTMFDICVEKCYQSVPLKCIKSKVFDAVDIIREMILLEVPITVECNDNHCPERERLKIK